MPGFGHPPSLLPHGGDRHCQAHAGLGSGGSHRTGRLRGWMADRRYLAATRVQLDQELHQRPAGRHGAACLVPVACFAVGGLGTFGFAVFGLRPALGRAGTIAAYAPWMLAVAGLAIGNSFPLIPCQRIVAGCTAHVQLHSPGGMTDAIVATIAFLVLAVTPFRCGGG